MPPLQRNLRNRPSQQTPTIRNKKDLLLWIPVLSRSCVLLLLLLLLLLLFGAGGAAKRVVEIISESED
jgi:hypothetical protein